MSVLIVTSVGDIVIDLHATRCPLTAKNFIKLCKMKYYNGCLFHKVEKDFMAQTGDPTGTGTAGDSVYKYLFGEQARFFDDEIHPDLKHSKTGTVAMASAGENCNASQFYFTLRDDIEYLDGKHTVFGIVEEKEGLDTLAKINETLVDDKGRPYKNIRIKHTYILDDPFDDPPQLAEFIPEKSPEGKPHDEVAEERLEDNWIPMDETLSGQDLQQVIHAKEAHTNAAILESIGDIPDADIKPPENVLFVCKLNPVTQDEDLHTIFSRFGTVVAADIIRDYKTGDSLCYAFIEFETNEACEAAYFKMDSTLIDDRRIHVDFSQSVHKLWKKFRQGTKTQSNTAGCFKCGAEDHIAKDCDPSGNDKQKGPNYVLKHENTQRGNDRQRYEMMFDEENLEDVEHQDKAKRQKSDNEKSDHSRHKDYERSDKRRPYGDRRDATREEEMIHESKRDDRFNNKANEERHAARNRDTRYQKPFDDRDHKKHYERSSKHRDVDERKDSGRISTERDYKKRDGGDQKSAGRTYNERDYKRRDVDSEREYKKRDVDSERSRKDDSHYRNRDRDDSPHRERRHR